MGLLFWLLIGLAAGAGAKMLTPQNESGGWVSSLVFGIVGSMVGGFLAGLVGIGGGGIIGSLIIAFLGALLVLYVYHKYLKEKFNLPF